MSCRTATLLGVVATLALTLSACTPSVGGLSDQPPPPAALAGIPKVTAPGAIAGLVTDQRSGRIEAGVLGREAALTWRTSLVGVPQHDTFNDALLCAARARVNQYGDDDKASSALTLDWGIPVAAGRAFGVRLRTRVTHGSEPETVTTETLYTLADTDAALASPVLVAEASRSAVVAEITTALREAERLPEGAHLDPAGVLADLVVRPDGSAIAVLSSSAGPISGQMPVGVALSAPFLADKLSPEGARVVRALSGQPDHSTSAPAAPTGPAHTVSDTFVGFTPAIPAPVVRAPEPEVVEPVDCATEKCVALTYDDGPGDHTAQLLDILRTERVPATFFVMGKHIALHPDLLEREAREGHAIGIHTWNHPDLTTVPDERIAAEIAATQHAIEAHTGISPTFMRPPYGAVDARVLAVLKQQGQGVVLWNIDTEDWRNKNTETTYERAVHNTHPGAIILMHDVHPYGPDATTRIIHTLRDQGFKFVTVPQLVGGTIEAGTRYFSQHEIR